MPWTEAQEQEEAETCSVRHGVGGVFPQDFETCLVNPSSWSSAYMRLDE